MSFGRMIHVSAHRVGRPRSRKGPRGKLAEALRAARAARGMTQHEAAEELGVDQGAFAKWESGSRHPSGLALRYLLEVWIPRSLKRREGGER